MWVATPFGFLMPCRIPPKYQDPKDPRTMQIRARRAKDLDILRALYMQGRLGPTVHTPDKDYEYRAYCIPEDWKIALCDMTDDVMTYDKFKPETYRFEDQQLHTAYNRIWSVIMDTLSTAKHREEYFGKFRDYGDAEYTVTGTGFPKAVEKAATVVGKGAAVVDGDTVDYDAELARLDAWYASREDPHDAGCERHDAVVSYEPPPGRHAAEPDGSLFRSVVPGVSDLSEEIEEIYARRHGYDDHRACDHLQSDSADDKCKRARIRHDDELIEQVRKEIDTCYDTFIAEMAAETAKTAAK